MTDVDITSLLKNFADDIKTELKRDIRANADISIKNHEETRKEIHGIRGEVHGLTNTVNILWRKVNGPNIPPPKTSGEYRRVDQSLVKEKPLAQSVSDHNLDLQSLRAQMIGLDKKVDGLGDKVQETTKAVDEAKGVARQVLVMNERQNASLGIDVSIRRIGEFVLWLKTKEGQRYAATLFAATTSLITALGTTYAIMTKRLPLPSDAAAPPTVQTVYIPVPVAPSLQAPSAPSGHP